MGGIIMCAVNPTEAGHELDATLALRPTTWGTFLVFRYINFNILGFPGGFFWLLFLHFFPF